MSVRNLIFGVSSVAVLCLICCDILLQHEADVITKCDSYFITECERSLLQNVSGFFITKCDSFITKNDSYKMG